EDPLERRASLGARGVARERFFRPLVPSDLQEIDVDAELLREQAVRVDELGRDAYRLDAPRGAHPDAPQTSRRYPARRFAPFIGVADDGLLRLLQLGEELGKPLRAGPAETRSAEAHEHARALRLRRQLLQQRDEPVIRLARARPEQIRTG